MPQYRAFELGSNGHFTGSRGFVCDNDGDAIIWAKQFSGDLPIELWSGERLVKDVPPRHRTAISYEIKDGRQRPTRKAASALGALAHLLAAAREIAER